MSRHSLYGLIQLGLGFPAADMDYVCNEIRRVTYDNGISITGRVGDNDAKSHYTLVGACLTAMASRTGARSVPFHTVIIKDAPIADVSPFARLLLAETQLLHLELSNCGIVDVEPLARALAGNQTTISIELTGNSIKNADPLFQALDGCNLSNLAMDHNRVRAIAPFKRGRLCHLDIADNRLTSLDTIADAIAGAGLFYLGLANNSITDADRLLVIMEKNPNVHTDLAGNPFNQRDKVRLRALE
jgi:hypothetical protein